jgi:methyl-accepting chemotaxis protein
VEHPDAAEGCGAIDHDEREGLTRPAGRRFAQLNPIREAISAVGMLRILWGLQMRDWFANLGVTFKLGMGFGLVLTLSILLALASWMSIDKLIWRGDRMTDISRLNDALMDLRVSRLHYMLSSGDEQSVQRVKALLDRFVTLHAETLPKFTLPKNRRLLELQGGQLEAYRASLNSMHDAYRAAHAALQQMSGQAELLEQALDKIRAEVIDVSSYDENRIAQLESVFHFKDVWQTTRYQVRGYTAHLPNASEQQAMQALEASRDAQRQLRDRLLSTHAAAVSRVSAALQAYDAALMAFKAADADIAAANKELVSQGDKIVGFSRALIEYQMQMRNDEAGQARSQQMLAIVLTLLVGIFFAWLITRQITRPLGDALVAVERIASGDLSQSLAVNRRDELGVLQQAVQRMGTTLRELIGAIRDGVGQIASAAQALSAVTEQASAGVNNQKVETDQVATAMHEMSATVQEVARNAAEASQAACNADGEAGAGGRVVNQAVAQIELLAAEVSRSTVAMGRLQQESHRIGSVMDVIKSVAEQTNLLALNAAIEAARAGEAGRGFAVVADEVRGLAQRTQKSTEEIEGLVAGLQQGTQQVASIMNDSRELTDNTVVLTRQAGDSLGVITRAVSNIQSMNQQIAAAAEQQSAVAEEISRSVIRVRDISEQSATACDETAKSSLELAHLGNRLQILVSHFRV